MINFSTMADNFVFVYFKENKFEVLDLEDAKVKHDELIKQGYKHVATLNPVGWIKHILNSEEIDIISDINEFKNEGINK